MGLVWSRAGLAFDGGSSVNARGSAAVNSGIGFETWAKNQKHPVAGCGVFWPFCDVCEFPFGCVPVASGKDPSYAHENIDWFGFLGPAFWRGHGPGAHECCAGSHSGGCASRWHHRHHGAGVGASLGAADRAFSGRRKQAWGGRQPGRRGGGQGPGRWQHLADEFYQPCDQCVALPELALRSHQGLYALDHGFILTLGSGRASVSAGKERGRTGQAGQGKARPAQFRDWRPGFFTASGR